LRFPNAQRDVFEARKSCGQNAGGAPYSVTIMSVARVRASA